MGKKLTLFDKICNMAKKNNDFAFTLLDQDNPYQVLDCTDTGCYGLNALLYNGDIFGGLADGKRVMIQGEESTAKSLFTSLIISSYLRKKPNAYCVMFESEGSTVLEQIQTTGIPMERILIVPVATVEELRTSILQFLDEIIIPAIRERKLLNRELAATKKEKEIDTIQKKINALPDPQQFIFCIDSLGMLPSASEVEKVVSGSDKKDMTRAQVIKGMSRVIALKCSFAQTPLLIVNHTYSAMDQYKPNQSSGGTGPRYMADVIIDLSKGKEKEGTNQVGVKIRAKLSKSRWAIEGKMIEIILHFKKGLYKFSDMVEKAYELGVFKKEGNSFLLPNGQKHSMASVRKKPSQFLTQDVMQAIGEAIKKDFSFGKLNQDIEDIDIEDEIQDTTEEQFNFNGEENAEE